MPLFPHVKAKVKEIKQNIATLYFASKDQTLPLLPKLMTLVTLGYALSPIDLIPDVIPILGYLDDLIILPALIILTIKLIPDEILAQAKKKALAHPILLKKSWLTGILFITIWILLLYFVVKRIMH